MEVLGLELYKGKAPPFAMVVDGLEKYRLYCFGYLEIILSSYVVSCNLVADFPWPIRLMEVHM